MTATSEEWATRAKRYLKGELKRAGVGYDLLAQRMTEMGLRETEGSITMKINRGAFPAWFLFAVMKAIGRDTIRIEDV